MGFSSRSLSPQLWAGRTVGLLGGSFNPAHAGHRHISLQALRRLGLDAVWWLVAPQNPLKPAKNMMPLKKRLEQAQAIASHPRIVVTDIERQLHTHYTADTLAALKSIFPSTRFVWLMGADNLQTVHLWHRWPDIFETVPVAVLDRPPQTRGIKSSPALLRFKAAHIPETRGSLLKNMQAPAWTFLHIPLHPASATQIRETRKLREKSR